MPGTLTLVGEGLALDYIFSASAVTRPTTWFMALHAGYNNGDGTLNEIPAGLGYARQAVTFARTGNVTANTNAIAYGPDIVTAWGTVTDVTIWDSLSGGRCLAQGQAGAAVAYSVNDYATFSIGSLTLTLT